MARRFHKKICNSTEVERCLMQDGRRQDQRHAFLRGLQASSKTLTPTLLSHIEISRGSAFSVKISYDPSCRSMLCLSVKDRALRPTWKLGQGRKEQVRGHIPFVFFSQL